MSVLGEELDGLHALGVARVAVHALLGQVAQVLQVPLLRARRRLWKQFRINDGEYVYVYRQSASRSVGRTAPRTSIQERPW